MGHRAMNVANIGETCGAAGMEALIRGEAWRFYHTPYAEMDKCVSGSRNYSNQQKETSIAPKAIPVHDTTQSFRARLALTKRATNIPNPAQLF